MLVSEDDASGSGAHRIVSHRHNVLRWAPLLGVSASERIDGHMALLCQRQTAEVRSAGTQYHAKIDCRAA